MVGITKGEKTSLVEGNGVLSTMTAAWREFVWGGLAAAFGESIMHPIDTLKTRMQSGPHFTLKSNGNVTQSISTILAADGVRGLYRGVAAGITGSLVTGATYFGFVETTKDWVHMKRPELAGPWALFLAGAAGDTIGAVVYVPSEVIKQRMQVQGTKQSWELASSTLHVKQVYYSGVFHAAKMIYAKEGCRGLYAGFLSTLARDVPFAGLQIMFYEVFKQRLGGHTFDKCSATHQFSSGEDFLLGGAAGGLSAFLTTPLDVIKTRMQVQGTSMRYKGWFHALQTIWREESFGGFFKGCVPRVVWWCPASALTFMAVERLRKEFNVEPTGKIDKIETVDVTSVVVPHPSKAR